MSLPPHRSPTEGRRPTVRRRPDTSLTTSHRQTLTGLTASTAYRFQVRSTDAAGNTASSTDAGFTTTTPTTAPGFTPGNPNGTATVPTGWQSRTSALPRSGDRQRDGRKLHLGSGGDRRHRRGSDHLQLRPRSADDHAVADAEGAQQSTRKLVIDGGGKVTLSGATPSASSTSTPATPRWARCPGTACTRRRGPVTVQNMTFANGNATNATYVSPGDRTGLERWRRDLRPRRPAQGRAVGVRPQHLRH